MGITDALATEIIKTYKKGYSEGFKDCIDCMIKSIEITIDNGFDQTMSLSEVILLLKAIKIPD